MAVLYALIAAVTLSSGASVDHHRAVSGHLARRPAQAPGPILATEVADDPFPLGADAKGEEGSTVAPAEPRPLKLSQFCADNSAACGCLSRSLTAHRCACLHGASSKLSVQIVFCVWRS